MTTMREKVVLRRRTTPKVVTLPNGTTFTARYERISRKQLPINIDTKNVRKICPRRKNMDILSLKDANKSRKKTRRKKLRFNRSAIALKTMKKNKRKQSGKGLGENLVKMALDLGSRALNSSIGKKLINKGIDSVPNIFKYGVSKVENKNFKKVMNSDIANMEVNEAQNKVSKKLNNLF